MLFLLLCAFLMLLYPSDIMLCARDACALFASAVLPGLFPFLTVMLLATSRLPQKRSAIPMALMGLLSGSPTGARLSSFGNFKPKSYRAFAHMTAVMSPMFLLGTVPHWLLGHGVPIFIASTLGAFLTAGLSLLLPMHTKGEVGKGENTVLSFSEAVNRAAQTMLTVCGCMVMGSCLSMLLGKFLPFCDAVTLALLQGFLEVTKGVKDISLIPFVDSRLAPALCAMLVSFGGVSLMMQNFAFYRKGSLPLLPYILLKAVHGAAAFGIAYVLIPLFPAQARETVSFHSASPALAPVLWGMAFLLSEIVLKWRELIKGRQRDAAG